MKKYICFDIGGTEIKYGVINQNSEILLKESVMTEAWKGGPKILQKVTAIVDNLINKNSDVYQGICISTAGMVDAEKGSIFYAAPLIPDYAGTAFKQTLEEKFHIPCEVENDVNCAGLAEYKSGAAKGSSVSVTITVGTGIGGCIIIDGKVFHGFSNSACEIGYMHMDESDFQTLGATSILTKKVAEYKNESAELWNGRRIFEKARKGDSICNCAINDMADVLGKGIANICYVVNPEIVVLGGGIMAQEDFLYDKIQNSVNKYLLSSISQHTKIAFAKHRNDAGMIGAFYNFCDVHLKE